MDLDDQANVNRLAEQSGTDDMVVILGQPDSTSAGLFAETVTRGDPTWAGPLAGVPLGLPVFHILEPEIKEQIDADLYQEHVGLMELAADVDEIIKWVKYPTGRRTTSIEPSSRLARAWRCGAPPIRGSEPRSSTASPRP